MGGVLEKARALNASFARGRALDFGCGIGRLTQALAGHFENAVGVDIAPAMIQAAKDQNRAPGRCEYLVNGRPDLSLFADAEFDFVFSTIVLQHVRTEYAERYIAEFLRVLRPGGLAVFQVPDRPAHTMIGTALRVLPMWAVRPVRKMDMYPVPRGRVEAIVAAGGARLLAAEPNFESGPHWTAYRYFAEKNRGGRS